MKDFKFPPLLMAVLVLVAAFLLFKYAFPPLLPMSLFIPYMTICAVGVLLFFSFDDDTWQRFKAPIAAVIEKESAWPVRWFLLLVIPFLVAYSSYIFITPSWDAPIESRQIHPAPPSKLNVFNKSYDLSKLENPVREAVIASMNAADKEKAWQIYNTAVTAGRDVYYQNCFFCHGDLMFGEGVFADGFNPRPISFQSDTINQLQESFIFWRTTTGGPGLPIEGAPWNSSMPAWHEMLTEQDIWNVITFLYDYTGEVPRIWDPEASKIVTAMTTELATKRAKMTGKVLYDLRCSVCHGEEGDGRGVAAEYQYPRPRDFTLGMFKYKTSPGTLPARDEDLFNSIKYGLNGTTMPGWSKLMSDEQIQSLLPVIKRFDVSATWSPDSAEDDDFDDAGRYLKDDFLVVTEAEPLEGQIAYSAESVARGKVAYESCQECHGLDGRGNIRSGKRLADDWGYRLWPRDLTIPWSWRMMITADSYDSMAKRDQIIKNIYLRLSIGIPGTSMPAHRAEEGNEDPISLDDRWHIANYVYSLLNQNVAPGRRVIHARKLTGELPTSVTDKAWTQAPLMSMRLMPNIIKEPRLFTPLNELLSVKVLYNEEEIAFLMSINDRTESLPGHEYSMSIQDETLTLFADAVAMQIPRQGAYNAQRMTEKPFFQHGDATHHTSMWYWNAGSIEPEKSALTTVFKGTGLDKPPEPIADYQDVSAQGKWYEGRWLIMMKRKRQGTRGEISFNEGEFIPIAFANWDGSNGETGARHTLTGWFWLLLPPKKEPLQVYGLPAGLGFLTFVSGLFLLRKYRKNN